MRDDVNINDNIEQAYAAAKAFNEGDVSVVLGLMSDSIVWHWGGTNQLAGDAKGKDAVLAKFGTAMLLTDGTLRIDLKDVLVSENRAVMFLDLSAERDGTPMRLNVAHASTLDDEGRWDEVWFLPSDQRTWDEVFA